MTSLRHRWRRWRYERQYGNARSRSRQSAVLAVLTVVVAGLLVWEVASYH